MFIFTIVFIVLFLFFQNHWFHSETTDKINQRYLRTISGRSEPSSPRRCRGARASEDGQRIAAEDLAAELVGALGRRDAGNGLAHFSPLALDVLCVDGHLHPINNRPVSVHPGVVDGCTDVLALKLPRVALPLVADEDGPGGDPPSDERGEGLRLAASR